MHVDRNVVNWVSDAAMPGAVTAPTRVEFAVIEKVLDARAGYVPMVPLPVGPAVAVASVPL